MNGNVKVWDIFVRFFHWAMAALLAVVFLTEDDFLTVHAAAGYVILFLIAGRVVWGFIGPQHARFADFVHPPRRTAEYLKDALRFRHRRTLGHNPVAGMMILAILFFVVMASVTGVIVYGAGEHAGPLAAMLAPYGWQYADALKEVHEFFAAGVIVLAGLHVAAALIESLHFKENLVLAMITGYKKKTIIDRSNNDEKSTDDGYGAGAQPFVYAVGAGGNGAGTNEGVSGGGRG